MITFANKLVKIVASLQRYSGITDDWSRKLLSVYLQFRADFQEHQGELEPKQKETLQTALDNVHLAIDQVQQSGYEEALASLWAATELVYGVQLELQGVEYSEAETLILDYESVSSILQKQFSVEYGLPR